MPTDRLPLVELTGLPVTRASADFRPRAWDLQQLIGEAHGYLCDGLRTDFAPTLTVLDEADWLTGDGEAPYGIPYASDTEYVLVMPADHAENFLVDIYAGAGSRAAAERFADLIAVHELGHLHTRALGLTLPQGWLSEFLATYLSCCYLAAQRPDDAELWFALSRAGTERARPEHRSLETLDELYFGVGPQDYIAYQDTLSGMVEQVHGDLGLDFALRLRSTGLTPQSDTRTTLAAAERIRPGFEDWAASLRG